jgi:dihydroneopterin aldolase
MRFLASVSGADEARIALAGGADIIDFKDPAHGALGALDPALVSQGRATVAGRAPTSATAGDEPLHPERLIAAARRTAATAVDFVKLGLLPGAQRAHCIAALAPLCAEMRLVAVFFADRELPRDELADLAAAGFHGAMLDTFDKTRGSLLQHHPVAALAPFVAAARAAGLMCGLAGSLRLPDIATLAPLQPDVLGFRGALCAPGGRTAALELKRVAEVRRAVTAASRTKPGTVNLGRE